MNRLLNRSLCVTLQALGVVALGATLPQAQADTTLRVGLNADIRSTEPGVNRDENTDTVILHIVEGLVAHREDASVGPLLAREVQVSDDGLTYTFKLREGVRFHNGATLERRRRQVDLGALPQAADTVALPGRVRWPWWGENHQHHHPRPAHRRLPARSAQRVVPGVHGASRLRRRRHSASGLGSGGWSMESADRHRAFHPE